MTKFTIDIADQDKLDGLQFAMDRYNASTSEKSQMAKLDDFVAYILSGHGQDYAMQKAVAEGDAAKEAIVQAYRDKQSAKEG